jgi:NADPH-dependent 2,4-dienoyl-CoA reductase/sulfur reductase-like enzyme/rhodanese-related sulfurtransferase
MKELLIIGGVAAGATAAARARRLDGDLNITILEAGADVSFANCGLPYFIGGDIEYRSSLILASPQTFHDQYRIDVHTHTEAIAIDRKTKTVRARNTETGNEKTFAYDKLILAQGGKPVVPPIPGADEDHVFQLWTLDDMDRIHRFIEETNPSNAVVVGGGFIGLEMVEALAKRGLNVSLVEMERQVMPNLEGEFAGFLTKTLQDFGVSLHLGTALKSIEDNSVALSDGSRVDADFVLLSVGVRPTLALARDAGLRIGDAGGLAVDSRLQTSDPDIFAAGDMVEIEHLVGETKARIPLAGPANRQGRVAAENALGAKRAYRGALGTAVVKVFDAVTGSTGLSLKAARQAGIDADAVVVHKVSHTAYYPGSEKVSLMVVYDPSSGRLLGAQAAGRVGVDKRLDVLATAIAGGLTLADLAELDLAYAPPFNSPNGPVNMAAFTAENHRTGFSPSVLAADIESFVTENEPIAIDLRDPISFGAAHLQGSTNLSQNQLRDSMDRVPTGDAVLLISDDGQKGHVALRMLKAAGIEKVFNLSGGYISLERHARAIGYESLRVGVFPTERRSISDLHGSTEQANGGTPDAGNQDGAGVPGDDVPSGPLVVDVRTPMEFEMGAYPGAINISLDDLPGRISELGDHSREVVVYCASGARSAYAANMLSQMGFTNVRNAGGIHDIMAAGV